MDMMEFFRRRMKESDKFDSLERKQLPNPYRNTYQAMMRVFSLAKGAKQFYGTIPPNKDWATTPSRQVRRAALRRIAFNQVTNSNFAIGRRRRRSAASMLARLMFAEGQAAWKPEVQP